LPFGHLVHAHCGICGNLDLKRIAPEHVTGLSAGMWRLLRLPAFRCDPCRHKFFSVRPHYRPNDAESEAAEEMLTD